MRDEYLAEKGLPNEEDVREKQAQPREPDHIEHQMKPEASGSSVSQDMLLKIKMNAGNTARAFCQMACDSAAKKEDGSMSEDSFTHYYDLLLEAYTKGLGRITGMSVGKDEEGKIM